MKVLIGLVIIYFTIFSIIEAIKDHKKNNKGKKGEKKTFENLSKLSSEYTILNDLLLENEAGLSQIDHVVVSKYGIFVIETKNYKGIIYGKEKDKTWLLTTGHKTHEFHSPIRQNYSHIKTLEYNLQIPNDNVFYSIVSFANSCRIDVISCNVAVITADNLYGEIKKHREVVFTDNQVKEIIDILENNNITSKKVRKQFVDEMKMKYADN